MSVTTIELHLGLYIVTIDFYLIRRSKESSYELKDLSSY